MAPAREGLAMRQRHREVTCTLLRRCKPPAGVGGGWSRQAPAEGRGPFQEGSWCVRGMEHEPSCGPAPWGTPK